MTELREYCRAFVYLAIARREAERAPGWLSAEQAARLRQLIQQAATAWDRLNAQDRYRVSYIAPEMLVSLYATPCDMMAWVAVFMPEHAARPGDKCTHEIDWLHNCPGCGRVVLA